MVSHIILYIYSVCVCDLELIGFRLFDFCNK